MRALGVCNVVGIAVAANRYFLLDVNLHVMNFSCIHVRVGQCFLTRDANHFGQAVIRCHVENLLGKTESVRQTQICDELTNFIKSVSSAVYPIYYHKNTSASLKVVFSDPLPRKC